MKKITIALFLLLSVWSNAWGWKTDYEFTSFPVEFDLSSTGGSSTMTNDNKLVVWNTYYIGGTSYYYLKRELNSYGTGAANGNIGGWFQSSGSQSVPFYSTRSQVAFSYFNGFSCVHYGAASSGVEFPKMPFIAGKKYKLTYSIKGFNCNAGTSIVETTPNEAMDIAIAPVQYAGGATFPTSGSTAYTILKSVSDINYNTYKESSFEFTAPDNLTDGGYIVLRCTSPGQGALCINNLKVEEVIEAAANPLAVDFEASAGMEVLNSIHTPVARFLFTAPSTFDNNEAITDATIDIDIYQNDVVAKTVTVAPGTLYGIGLSEAETHNADYYVILEKGVNTFYAKARTAAGGESVASTSFSLDYDEVTTAVNALSGDKSHFDAAAGIYYLAAPTADASVYSLSGACLYKAATAVSSIDLNAFAQPALLLKIDGKAVKIVK